MSDYEKAKQLYTMKAYNDAGKLFAKVIEDEPENELAFFGRGMCYRSLALHTDDSSAKLRYAQFAVEDFTHTFELKNTFVECLSRRGQVHHHFLKDFSKAFKDYSAYLKAVPDDGQIIYEKNLLLVLHFKLGEKQLEAAKRDIENVLAKQQDSPNFVKKLKALLDQIARVQKGETVQKESDLKPGTMMQMESPRGHHIPDAGTQKNAPKKQPQTLKLENTKFSQKDVTLNVKKTALEEMVAQKKERIRNASILLNDKQMDTGMKYGHREGSFLKNPTLSSQITGSNLPKISVDKVLGVQDYSSKTSPRASPRGSILEQKRAHRRTQLNAMTQEVANIQVPSIVIQSFGEKLGEKVKSWTDRYFVLYNNGNFEYYYNVPPPKSTFEKPDFKKGELRGKVSVNGCRFKYIRGPNVEPYGFIIYLKNNRDFTIAFSDRSLALDWKTEMTKLGCLYEDTDTFEISYAGFAEKLGEKVKSWNDRYFVLYPNGDLEYYSGLKPNPKEQILDFKKGELKGKFNVAGCPFKLLKGYEGKTYGLVIQLDTGRDFCLCFAKQDFLDEWKRSLLLTGCKYFDDSLQGSGVNLPNKLNVKARLHFMELKDLASDNNKERSFYFTVSDGTSSKTSPEVFLKSSETNQARVVLKNCIVDFDCVLERDKGKFKEKPITISLFVDGKKTLFGSAKPSWVHSLAMERCVDENKDLYKLDKEEHIKFSRHAEGYMIFTIYSWTSNNTFDQVYEESKKQKQRPSMLRSLSILTSKEQIDEEAEEKKMLQEVLKQEESRNREEVKRIEEMKQKILIEEERIRRIEEEEDRKRTELEEEKRKKLEKLREEQEKKRKEREAREAEELKQKQEMEKEEAQKAREEAIRKQEELMKAEELRIRREKRLAEEQRKKEELQRQYEEEIALAEELRKKKEAEKKLAQELFEKEEKEKMEKAEQRLAEIKRRQLEDERESERLRVQREEELLRQKDVAEKKRENMVLTREQRLKKIEEEEKQKEDDRHRQFAEEKAREDERRRKEEDEKRDEEHALEEKIRQQEEQRREQERLSKQQTQLTAQQTRENLILEKKKRDEEEKKKLLAKRMEKKNNPGVAPTPEPLKQDDIDHLKKLREDRLEKERLEKEQLEKEESLKRQSQGDPTVFREIEKLRLERESSLLKDEAKKRELEEKQRVEADDRLRRVQEMMQEKERKRLEEEKRQREEKQREMEAIRKQKEEEIEKIRLEKEKMSQTIEKQRLADLEQLKKRELEELEAKRIQEEKDRIEREQRNKIQAETDRVRLEEEKARQEKIRIENEKLRIKQEQERQRIEQEQKKIEEAIRKENEEKEKIRVEQERKEKEEREAKEHEIAQQRLKEEEKRKLEESLKPKAVEPESDGDDESPGEGEDPSTMDEMLSMFLGGDDENESTPGKPVRKDVNGDKKEVSNKLVLEALHTKQQLKKTYEDIDEPTAEPVEVEIEVEEEVDAPYEPSPEEIKAKEDLDKVNIEINRVKKLVDEKQAISNDLKVKIQVVEQKINKMETSEEESIQDYVFKQMTSEEQEEYLQNLEDEEENAISGASKKKKKSDKKKMKGFGDSDEEDPSDEEDDDEDAKTQEEKELEEELKLLEEEERLIEAQLNGEDEELTLLKQEVNELKQKKKKLLKNAPEDEAEQIEEEDLEFEELHQYETEEEKQENLLYDLHDLKQLLETQIEILVEVKKLLDEESGSKKRLLEEESKQKKEKARKAYQEDLSKLYDDRDKLEGQIHEILDEEQFLRSDYQKLVTKETNLRAIISSGGQNVDLEQFPELGRKLKVLERLLDKKQLGKQEFDEKKEDLMREFFPSRNKKKILKKVMKKVIVGAPKPPPLMSNAPPPPPMALNIPKAPVVRLDKLTKQIEDSKAKKQAGFEDKDQLLKDIKAKKEGLNIIEKDKKEVKKVNHGWIGEEIIRNRDAYDSDSGDEREFD